MTDQEITALKAENKKLQDRLERFSAEYDYAFAGMLKENEDPSADEYLSKALGDTFTRGYKVGMAVMQSYIADFLEKSAKERFLADTVRELPPPTYPTEPVTFVTNISTGLVIANLQNAEIKFGSP